MERTVPRVASEEIELYLRTYYSLLRSTAEVHVRTLEEAHAGMNSLLHPDARQPSPDMSAFIYCLLRLPECMWQVDLVVLGQSPEVFAKKGIGQLEDWEDVSAPARRRRCFFDGENTLACLIASRSDIDDLVPMLTAYQIEWNKLNRLMGQFPDGFLLDAIEDDEQACHTLVETLGLAPEDLDHLKAIWKSDFIGNLKCIAAQRRDLRVQLLSASLSEYRRATHAWWQRIEAASPDILARPVYFVSSNAHSLVNILSGFALQRQDLLLDYLERSDDSDLLEEWKDIQAREVPSSRENFFYYVLKKYLRTPAGRELRQERLEAEKACGIARITSAHSFDLEAQVVDLSRLDAAKLDPRLGLDGQDLLASSDALILNIDYPLGLAAYDVLREVSDQAGEVLGVYMMGKAATLNGVIGDVMLPNVVYDGHSYNTYMFANSIQADDVAPYLTYGTVLDNQKGVSVRGTFLQNASYMDVFYREGYTDIEMEAGPYLSAVYEMYRPKRHPSDEIVNLYGLPFDLGMLHYASDTPLSKGRNLGAANLSYFGMDPSYAAALAILRRILKLERARLGRAQPVQQLS